MPYTDNDLLRKSDLYRECQAEKDEILRHKWFKSQEAGKDIGFDRAYFEWIMFHRDQWRQEHRQKNQRIAS